MQTDQFEFKELPGVGAVHRNLPVAQLVETSVRQNETRLADNGALVGLTGEKTGRSPKDKFIVREPSSEARIWWGKINQPMPPDNFKRLRAKVAGHFKGKDVFVFDGFAGADPEHRLSIRIITAHAWHSLFARQLFRRPTDEELKNHQPQFTVICAPECKADPATDGTNTGTFIALDFESRTVLIGGTHYAGEIKKSIFTVMNYLMPQQNTLPMHCSANVGDKGDVAVFFGLSGTGKTSLSADMTRHLIGDDEHGWGANGVFNFEGGCYAKCIRLSHKREPQIWDAIKFGAVLENVVMDTATRKIDYASDALTENTRVAYPLDFIGNAVASGMAGHPKSIIFLAADAFGILPPLARLNETQAMYHFLSGYTAKLAGTEAGMGKEPEATFSTCFGSPFLPLPPRVYADMLAKKMREHKCRCYLINTGWVGGPAGVAPRIPIEYNRISITEILNGGIDSVPFVKDPVFGFDVPQRCGAIPAELFKLRETWKNPADYDVKARELAQRFVKNFGQYLADATDIAAGGPKV